MSEQRPLFILAGNGAYGSRGCEAITRGTVKILREHFGHSRFVCVSQCLAEGELEDQRRRETDADITHLAVRPIGRRALLRNGWRPAMWPRAFQFCFRREAFYDWIFRDLRSHLGEAAAVLSVGGDTYSLDYGPPAIFTALDDLVLRHRKPIVLWGASVGPFRARPQYERYMAEHLQKVTAILAREPDTVAYLAGLGVSRNVHLVADPAFLMDPTPPVEAPPIEPGAIGLNLSPLMAGYVTGGDGTRWTAIASEIVQAVATNLGRQVCLIPHDTRPHTDDYAFMRRAMALGSNPTRNVLLIPPDYDAAETKWIIGQMALFAGARTHATIAALSSGIPTLSFAYSMKAGGINKDIFGHADYCIGPKDLNPGEVLRRIRLALDEEDAIRRRIAATLPNLQRRALSAGSILAALIRWSFAENDTSV